MKRAHGGDEEVVIRSTRGNPAQGFETEVIRKPAKGYHFTYAQFEADFEFWNRLLKVPVHESESKNRAVGRMAAGHHSISLGDSDVEYGFEFEDGKKALQGHMADVKYNAPKHAVLPNGGDDHDWDCWEIVKPIFNHSQPLSIRIESCVRDGIQYHQSQRTVELQTSRSCHQSRRRRGIRSSPRRSRRRCQCNPMSRNVASNDARDRPEEASDRRGHQSQVWTR